jgi:branched-chain amino acid transport system substrate-binding protein
MRVQKLIAGIGLAVLWALFFVICPSAAVAQAQKPVVFALIEPLSGPFKDVGTEVAAYVEYGIEQVNAAGGVLGRQVKLIQYDNQMKPDVAVRQAKKAVQEDGATVIMNHTSSAVGLALAKVAKELNVIHVTLHNEADEIMGSEFETNTFRVCLSTSMHSGILANYFAQSPHKRFYLLNQDYAFGHAVADSFKKIFLRVKRADQEIVGDDYHPMATKDFGPYITKAIAAKPDVIITGNFGPDLPSMMKQSRDLGLKAIFGSYYLDNSSYMYQAREAGIGAVTAELYLSTLKTKKNQEFIKAWQAWFKKHYSDRPTFYLVPSSVALSVDAMSFLAEAIKKAKSLEADKIVAAWEGMSFEGITGKTTMRACDHQILTPGYIGVMQTNHVFKNILDFPFLGDPIVIPPEKFIVAPKDTGNARCK